MLMYSLLLLRQYHENTGLCASLLGAEKLLGR